MLELSKERIEKILHEESPAKEDQDVILRAIYNRYMDLYERYFADIDALNDEKIAEFRAYHEETKSLFKYYYVDIPLDVCDGLRKFYKESDCKFLGPKWHNELTELYDDFKNTNTDITISDEELKKKFSEKTLGDFYKSMDYIFRDSFGTESEADKVQVSWFRRIFFGEKEKKSDN
jgi:hypothetical protein